MKDKKTSWMIFVLIFFSLLMISCAPKMYRMHPEFEARMEKIHTPGLLPPDVKVYEISAGGVPELKDEWCAIGKDNVVQSLGQNFEAKAYKIKPLDIDADTRQELEDIKALYRAVAASIRTHTYGGPAGFPEKMQNFDYSVGAIKSTLEKLNADALVFFYCSDQILTGGRKAIMAAGVIVGALVGIQVTPVGGWTIGSIAIVDSSGKILWFNTKTAAGTYDLRDHGSTASLVTELLKDLPEVK